jgi:ATP-dependent Lon protease
MRDYRDAKAMARRLREALAHKGLALSHSDCLELIARSFGLKDWQVLAAAMAQDDETPPPAEAAPPLPWSGPVLALRDIVILPKQTAPVFVGREVSKRAVGRAYEGELEVLLVTQRDRADDNPGMEGLYGVGVIADVLQRDVLAAGEVKLVVRGRQRARLLAVTDEAGYRRAEATPLATGPADFAGAAARVAAAAAAFDAYAETRGLAAQVRAWAAGVTHAGVLGDLIAAFAVAPIAEKQAILETTGPRQRLELAVRLIPPADAKAA